MRLFLASVLFFIIQSIGAQVNIGHDTDVFTVDSSLKPVFCFHFKCRPNYLYRLAYVRRAEVLSKKISLDKTHWNLRFRDSDTFFCQDLRDSLGEYYACLETINTNGLRDTQFVKIYNNFYSEVRPPMLFVRMGMIDSSDILSSEVFNISIKYPEYYHLLIYDSWGNQVFESVSVENDWNGRINNGSTLCAAGVYYYTLEYRLKGKDKNVSKINGMVRLWR